MPVIMNKDMVDFYRFVFVKSEFFNANYPALTTVGTTGLVHPDVEVGIKAAAVIGNN